MSPFSPKYDTVHLKISIYLSIPLFFLTFWLWSSISLARLRCRYSLACAGSLALTGPLMAETSDCILLAKFDDVKTVKQSVQNTSTISSKHFMV